MDKVRCEECGGTGKVQPYGRTENNLALSFPNCPTCEGSGLRPLSFADLREAAHLGLPGETMDGVISEWLKTRYGVEVKDG